MKRTAIIRAAIFFVAVMTTSNLASEALRGTFRGELVPEGPAIVVNLEDLVQISLPASSKFTRALEVEIQIPRELLPYRSNFAVFVYQHYVAPKNGVTSYGDRTSIEVLPPSGKFYLQFPLVPKAGLKAAVDTAVVKIPGGDKSFPFAICILPIDKGLPTEIQKVQFPIRIRYLNANLGGLNVLTPNLTPEQRKALKITANGVEQASEGSLYLEPGMYSLELNLKGYSPVSINAAVAQAKMTEVSVNLEEEISAVLIEAPEGATVFIDGKKIAWSPLTPFPVDKGLHTIQFIVGNSQVTDNFEIKTGGKRKIVLSMQIQVEGDN